MFNHRFLLARNISCQGTDRHNKERRWNEQLTWLPAAAVSGNPTAADTNLRLLRLTGALSTPQQHTRHRQKHQHLEAID